MASGNSLIAFEPTDHRPPTTNFATLDWRNGVPCLDFDAAVAETTYFLGFMPRHYSGGGITLTLPWAATTATSGQVQWQVAFERHDPTNDLDADSFGTATSAALATTNASSGNPTYTTIAISVGSMDGVTVGDRFRLKVTRLVAGGMSGDAELLGVHIHET